MAPVTDRGNGMDGGRPLSWRGRSGRAYALEPVRLETFTLMGNELYLIALGQHLLWAGAASDLVGDAESRARFRLAVACADRAFRVKGGGDEVQRMMVAWDLEDAEPLPGVNAA